MLVLIDRRNLRGAPTPMHTYLVHQDSPSRPLDIAQGVQGASAKLPFTLFYSHTDRLPAVAVPWEAQARSFDRAAMPLD